MPAAFPASLAFFTSLCIQVQNENSLSAKSDIIARCVARYEGDLELLFKLLLPKYTGRIYHLKDKQLIKLLSSLLGTSEGALKDHCDKSGCIATTAAVFLRPAVSASHMSLAEFEGHLAALANVTMEEQQRAAMAKFISRATKDDLFAYLRQVKLDLRLGAGIRIVLAGLHPCANDLYKQCSNIADVVKKVISGDTAIPVAGDHVAASDRSTSPSRLKQGHITATITLGVPISPMLAAPSKGAEAVVAKCPNGCYSETKYDGERIQIHKRGSSFSFFARSTKPMKEDKYEGLEKYITEAITATDCVLDGEILLVDTTTSQPLPFGTLGKHKKAQQGAANTAIFLFDILYVDGESLFQVPLDKRRERLMTVVKSIPNRILFSDLRVVSGTHDEQVSKLTKHLNFAIATGLEGLVVKDVKSRYEPGARHWLKLKKDYLDGCGDTADLILLGAWYGTGAKGGKLSTFLMGVVDSSMPVGTPGRFKTVTSVANGLDDSTLDAWQPIFQRNMVKTSGEAPLWLSAHSSNVPDMVFRDPYNAPVFEMLCNEFTVSRVHTAASISMRFGRIVRERTDKDPSTATTLAELQSLVALAKQKAPLHNETAAPTVPTHANAEAAGSTKPNLTQPKLSFSQKDLQRQPPAAVSGCAPYAELSSRAPATGSLIRTVTHDVAQPISVPGIDQPNMLILHCVALGGKWSSRGVMGAITAIHGDECREAYDEAAANVKLGDLVVVEVSNRLTSGKLFVASLIGQSPPTVTGSAPRMDMDALARGLTKAAKFSLRNECSIHFARPDRSTGVDWVATEALLMSTFAGQKLHTTVYLREAPLGRSDSIHGVAPKAPLCMDADYKKHQTPFADSVKPQGVDGSAIMGGLSLVIVSGDPDAGYLTQRQAEAVKQKAKMLGASVLVCVSTSRIESFASHVVTDGAFVPSPPTATIVQRSWVDACFAENRLLDAARYALRAPQRHEEEKLETIPSASTLFGVMSGCRCVISSEIEAKTADAIANQVRMMGGAIHPRWTLVGSAASTHFVGASTTACPEALTVMHMGGLAVSVSWIEEAFATGRLPNVAPYLIKESRAQAAPKMRDAAPQAQRATRARTPDFEPTATDIAGIEAEAAAFVRSTSAVSVSQRDVAFVCLGYAPSLTTVLERSLEKLGATRLSQAPHGALKVCVTDTLSEQSAPFVAASRVPGDTKCVRLSWLMACIRVRTLCFAFEDYSYTPRGGAVSARLPSYAQDSVVIQAANAPASVGKQFVSREAAVSSSPSTRTAAALILPSTFSIDDMVKAAEGDHQPSPLGEYDSDSTMSYEFDDHNSQPPRRRHRIEGSSDATLSDGLP